MKIAESYPNGYKTLWEKEKLLVTSNFSFSHSVFKRLVSLGHQNVLLCGNGLTLYHTILTFNDHVEKKAFKIIVGRGENADNQHFLLFPHVFYPSKKKKNLFLSYIYSVVCKHFQFLCFFGMDFVCKSMITSKSSHDCGSINSRLSNKCLNHPHFLLFS